MKKRWMTLLLLIALGTSGCMTYDVTFVNPTSESLAFTLYGPGSGVGELGTLPGNGTLQARIVVSPLDLPTTYTYTVGTRHGAFSLASDSNSTLRLTISPQQ